MGRNLAFILLATALILSSAASALGWFRAVDDFDDENIDAWATASPRGVYLRCEDVDCDVDVSGAFDMDLATDGTKLFADQFDGTPQEDDTRLMHNGAKTFYAGAIIWFAAIATMILTLGGVPFMREENRFVAGQVGMLSQLTLSVVGALLLIIGGSMFMNGANDFEKGLGENIVAFMPWFGLFVGIAGTLCAIGATVFWLFSRDDTACHPAISD